MRPHLNYISPIGRSLKALPHFENPKIFLFLMSRTVLEIWIILCLKILRRRIPNSNFIQPIERSLELNFPLENQKFYPFFYISNGSWVMGKYMLQTTTQAHPPLQFNSVNRKEPQSKIPYRKPKNFTRFSISRTIYEIWVILRRKLLRRRTPHSNFIQLIERSL